MSESKNNNTGVTFIGLLQLLFIYLKLTSQINWSWFWVLSPTIIPTVIALIILITVLIMVNK